MQRIFRNPYYSSPSMRFSSTESVRTRELSLAGKRDSRRHFERFPFILKKKKKKKKKPVVPLGNQIERFLPLAILGNKPRFSTRNMGHECDKANNSVIFWLFW